MWRQSAHKSNVAGGQHTGTIWQVKWVVSSRLLAKPMPYPLPSELPNEPKNHLSNNSPLTQILWKLYHVLHGTAHKWVKISSTKIKTCIVKVGPEDIASPAPDWNGRGRTGESRSSPSLRTAVSPTGPSRKGWSRQRWAGSC